MADHPDAVLDLIDGTLRDYEVSADAMRWTPDEQVREREDTTYADVHLRLAADLAPFTVSMAEAGRNITRLIDSMARSVARWPLTKALTQLAELIEHDADARERPRWHNRRCARCNPACASTSSWGAAGHEYHRRRKARARRRR